MSLAVSLSVVAGCAADDRTGSGSIRGTLAVYISTSEDGHKGTHYALQVGGHEADQRRLVFANVPELAPNAAIEVWGQVYSDRIVVDRYEVLPAHEADVEVARQPLIGGTPYPTRSFAFVMVDIGGGNGSLTAANAWIDMFGTGPTDASVKQFYQEASYGRQDISGGLVELSYFMSGCNYTAVSSALRSQVDAALGYTPQHYMWYFRTNNNACGWAGVAQVGSPALPARDTWYNSSSSCVVLTQEPGHNWGMQHSSSVRCVSTPLANDPTTCTHDEYGDRYDVMGGGCRHLNAWQKGSQGYFGGCNRVRVNSSGTFTLLPLEVACNGIQVLQIPMPVQNRKILRSGGGGQPSGDPVKFYYLELRTRTGFDQPMLNAPTVLVHVADEYRSRTQSGLHTWILDMNPSTTGLNSFDGMGAGATFADPAGGVSFTVQSLSASGATINVTIANGSGAPTCFDGGTVTPPGPSTCGP